MNDRATTVEDFKQGDVVTHVAMGDGVVTRNDGRYVEMLYSDKTRGKYDKLWFDLYPTWLFHRRSAATPQES